MQMPQKHKLVVLGGQHVGKTSIISQYTDGSISEHYQATIGIDFVAKSVLRPDGQIRFHIWDTSGQEKFQNLARAYMEGASAAIVVYDVTQPESLEQAEWWVDKVHEVCGKAPVIALVGNKADIVSEQKVYKDEGGHLAQDLGIKLFMEASAKTGENIEALFQKLAHALPIEGKRNGHTEAANLVPEDEGVARFCGCWPRRRWASTDKLPCN